MLLKKTTILEASIKKINLMEVNMDKVNQFMKNVFPTLEEDEHITVVRINDNKTEEIRCKDVDEVLSFCNRKDKYFYNSYYTLTSTDGMGRATNNLRTRSCLCWDFDKKDLGQDFNVKDILHLFKSIRLYYHCIVDTGHGFHIYVFIEPTTDLEAVELFRGLLRYVLMPTLMPH